MNALVNHLRHLLLRLLGLQWVSLAVLFILVIDSGRAARTGIKAALIAVPEETLLIQAHLVAQIAEHPVTVADSISLRDTLCDLQQVAISALGAVCTDSVVAAGRAEVVVGVLVHHAGLAHKLAMQGLTSCDQNMTLIACSLMSASWSRLVLVVRLRNVQGWALCLLQRSKLGDLWLLVLTDKLLHLAEIRDFPWVKPLLLVRITHLRHCAHRIAKRWISCIHL